MRLVTRGALMLLSLGLGGCGSGRPSSSSGQHQKQVAAKTSPTQSTRARRHLPPTTLYRAPANLLDRHDLPPAGVQAQVTFFQEGGPPGCWRIPAPGTLLFGRGELRQVPGPSEQESLEPEQGETFVACLGTVAGNETPVDFTMQGPDGSVQRATRSAGGTEVPWYTDFSDDAPTGSYTVTAHQGSTRIVRKFTLRTASQPVYHVETLLKGKRADVALLGLWPEEVAHIAFYEGVPNQGAMMPRARYVTSATVQAGSDGKAVYRFDFGPSNGSTCRFFIAKVEVRGRWLDDLDNTISEFTPPCE